MFVVCRDEVVGHFLMHVPYVYSFSKTEFQPIVLDKSCSIAADSNVVISMLILPDVAVRHAWIHPGARPSTTPRMCLIHRGYRLPNPEALFVYTSTRVRLHQATFPHLTRPPNVRRPVLSFSDVQNFLSLASVVPIDDGFALLSRYCLRGFPRFGPAACYRL